MNKCRLLHFLTVTTAALALTISCSDSVTDSTPKAVGDPNDAEFAAISEQLSNVALDFDALDWADAIWDSVPGFSPRANANGDIKLYRGGAVGGELLSYSLTIDSISFWHIFSITVAELGDTATVIDSIRFSDANGPGLPAVLGELNITSVDIHVHAQASLNDSTFSGSIGSHSILTVAILGFGDSTGGDTLSFSGTSFDTLTATASDSGTTCQFTISSSKTATNVLTIDDLEHPCPIGGSISASATVDVLCSIATGTGTDSLSVKGAWTVSASFNSDGSVNLVYENSNTRWTATEPCTPGAQASGLAGVSIRPGGGN